MPKFAFLIKELMSGEGRDVICESLMGAASVSGIPYRTLQRNMKISGYYLGYGHYIQKIEFIKDRREGNGNKFFGKRRSEGV